jgi:Flp pilus assembly protein TadD
MTRLLRIVATATALIILPLLAQEPAAPSTSDEFTKAVYFGKSFFGMQDYASAYEQFAKADALQPDQSAVLYDMALLLAKTGRFSEAQVKVDRYMQLHPDGAEKQLVTQLQLTLEFQRELQKKRQVDQEFNDLFTKGRFLYGRNELANALRLFQDAEQRRASEPAAIYDQAVIYEKLGDFPKAAERYRRYLELESDADAKGAIDQHVVGLEGEIEDMRTKIVCSFCGHRLANGATWCHRCWHGPYLAKSPSWNSRPCVEGATATRSTFYSGDRFARNETLPCLFDGPMAEALRYSPSRQRNIQEARKAEGWSYNGEVIQSWKDKDGAAIRYVQGAEYLEKIDSTGGEILNFAAHRAGEGWLLDREDWIIDGQKYMSRFTFDADGRIAQQVVEYQNTAACNHFITATADYKWEGDRLTGAAIKGAYDGYVAEGTPHTEWQAAIVNSFDELGRVTKEDLTVTSFAKTYMTKPVGPERDSVNAMYPTMRVKRPLTDLLRTGDLCGAANGRYVANFIDLRPFYAISPNLNVVLPNGITRATVTLAYPTTFKP